MKNKTANFKILALERLNNSYYGNPAFRITAENEHGETVIGRTASNAALGYALGYSHEGKTILLDYHTTTSGNLIFDRLANA